ncbi:hypothetical protein BZA05DRAFT_395285 [Tricharina praecox]|uniref:uncharacterized protein n=1 Tax=Tricharina praecox TaxID=43433 RepID=UPI0022203AE9|nr:uncharacterized protein BZA05DRAFT_395285 [Tricharina praecox]KAI5853980.1 hypothetical protein BZA05DRAFT_395285 [Tricharina praecox]
MLLLTGRWGVFVYAVSSLDLAATRGLVPEAMLCYIHTGREGTGWRLCCVMCGCVCMCERATSRGWGEGGLVEWVGR